MAAQTKVARVYARAIAELKDANLEQVVAELRSFSSMVEESKELGLVVSSDAFSGEQRTGVVESVAQQAKFSSVTQRILVVLSQAKRVRIASEVAEVLEQLVLESKGIVPLKVESQQDLAEGEKNSVVERFKSLFGKEVEPTYTVNPALIGGVRVTADGKTYDGSLVTRLESLREQLVGGA